MTLIFDTADEVVPLLHQIVTLLDTMESRMADITTDITALGTAVSAVSADVQAVLAQLASQPNLSPAQQALLETQIAALQQLDTTIQAAVTPPDPNPNPNPPPTQGRR